MLIRYISETYSSTENEKEFHLKTTRKNNDKEGIMSYLKFSLVKLEDKMLQINTAVSALNSYNEVKS
jgi:hypothetical protein